MKNAVRSIASTLVRLADGLVAGGTNAGAGQRSRSAGFQVGMRAKSPARIASAICANSEVKKLLAVPSGSGLLVARDRFLSGNLAGCQKEEEMSRTASQPALVGENTLRALLLICCLPMALRFRHGSMAKDSDIKFDFLATV